MCGRQFVNAVIADDRIVALAAFEPVAGNANRRFGNGFVIQFIANDIAIER